MITCCFFFRKGRICSTWLELGWYPSLKLTTKLAPEKNGKFGPKRNGSSSNFLHFQGNLNSLLCPKPWESCRLEVSKPSAGPPSCVPIAPRFLLRNPLGVFFSPKVLAKIVGGYFFWWMWPNKKKETLNSDHLPTHLVWRCFFHVFRVGSRFVFTFVALERDDFFQSRYTLGNYHDNVKPTIWRCILLKIGDFPWGISFGCFELMGYYRLVNDDIYKA